METIFDMHRDVIKQRVHNWKGYMAGRIDPSNGYSLHVATDDWKVQVQECITFILWGLLLTT